VVADKATTRGVVVTKTSAPMAAVGRIASVGQSSDEDRPAAGIFVMDDVIHDAGALVVV
jgi:hypothetical protein